MIPKTEKYCKGESENSVARQAITNESRAEKRGEIDS